jgi:uncharacterized protein (TIGR02421 family)
MSSRERTLALLDRASAALAPHVRQVRLLPAIAWPREVERAFFASGASALPVVSYDIDRDAANARIASLRAVEQSIEGDDRVCEWLRSTARSLLDGNRLLLAVGTREFHRLSREVYGSATTSVQPGVPTNFDLARHLLERLSLHGYDAVPESEPHRLSADEARHRFESRLALRDPPLEVSIEVDAACTSKVVAGMSRVRVRAGATFASQEVDGLFVHEIETHALSAQNGAAQPHAAFLRAGGPRSTRTQEGLAIFAELYDHTLTIERTRRLATRVELVKLAEDGASFVDLYRALLDRGWDEHDAFFDAERICRGGLVEGGAPFTKDAVYVAGLLQVYGFLRGVLRGGLRDEAEMLVAGRFALEDIAAIVQLRHEGILERPKLRPQWLENWSGLLPLFAFTSFADDIGVAQFERQFADVIALAETQQAPRRR